MLSCCNGQNKCLSWNLGLQAVGQSHLDQDCPVKCKKSGSPDQCTKPLVSLVDNWKFLWWNMGTLITFYFFCSWNINSVWRFVCKGEYYWLKLLGIDHEVGNYCKYPPIKERLQHFCQILCMKYVHAQHIWRSKSYDNLLNHKINKMYPMVLQFICIFDTLSTPWLILLRGTTVTLLTSEELKSATNL